MFELDADAAIYFFEVTFAQRIIDRFQELFRLVRFADEIVGAAAQGPDCGIDGRIATDDDHRGIQSFTADEFHDVEPGHVGQHKIEQN